jgi:hypothetical protein
MALKDKLWIKLQSATYFYLILKNKNISMKKSSTKVKLPTNS